MKITAEELEKAFEQYILYGSIVLVLDEKTGERRVADPRDVRFVYKEDSE